MLRRECRPSFTLFFKRSILKSLPVRKEEKKTSRFSSSRSCYTCFASAETELPFNGARLFLTQLSGGACLHSQLSDYCKKQRSKSGAVTGEVALHQHPWLSRGVLMLALKTDAPPKTPSNANIRRNHQHSDYFSPLLPRRLATSIAPPWETQGCILFIFLQSAERWAGLWADAQHIFFGRLNRISF